MHATQLHWMRFLAMVCLGTFVLPLSGSAQTENSDLFPPELVRFQAADINPLFQGRGKGHWDEHIRERGWIMREGGKWHM